MLKQEEFKAVNGQHFTPKDVFYEAVKGKNPYIFPNNAYVMKGTQKMWFCHLCQLHFDDIYSHYVENHMVISGVTCNCGMPLESKCREPRSKPVTQEAEELKQDLLKN